MSGEQQEFGAIQNRTLTVTLPEGFGMDEGKVRALIEERIGDGEFPVERVADMISAAIEAVQTQRIVIQIKDTPLVEVSRQHYKFEFLLRAIKAGLNVLLVGPAGSGKTTAAMEAAKALGKQFYCMSVGNQTSKSDLFGFIDANGRYHETLLVKAAKGGAVFLMDELDAGNACVLTLVNMLLANGHFATPEGMQTKHEGFVLIAGANTFGMGANRVYVGRNQLDAATLDRFVIIDWDYDKGLEAFIVGCTARSPKFKVDAGGVMEAQAWFELVGEARRASDKLGLRHVVSPRATIHGVRLFAAGVGADHVKDAVLWKGCDTATVKKIEAEMNGGKSE